MSRSVRSAITGWALLFFAAGSAPLSAQGEPAAVDFHESLGKVNQSFKGDQPRTVILIQDAHANFECQDHVVEILNALGQTRNDFLIGLEGAEGSFETELFSDFPNKKITQDLTTYFLKEAKLSGPEFFKINSEFAKGAELFGVDDRAAYLSNLELFRKAYRRIESLNPSLKALQENLAELKSKIYTQEMRALDRLSHSYERGETAFEEYFQGLVGMAQGHRVNLSSFPQILKEKEAFELRARASDAALEEERTQLLDELGGLFPEASARLARETLRFQFRRVSAKAYYRMLMDFAQAKRVDLKPYPHLMLYGQYLARVSDVLEPLLFDEMEKLKSQLKKKMLRSPLALSLNELDERIALLMRLVQLRITNEDFEKLKADPQKFAYSSVVSPLSEMARDRGMAQFYPGDLKGLDEALNDFQAFYQKALERDSILLERTLARMEEKKSSLAVLVAGGFHTRGITRALKEKGISFFVVTPSVTRRNVPTPYFSILMDEWDPMDRWLAGPGALQIPLPTAENPFSPTLGILVRKLFLGLVPAMELSLRSEAAEPFDLQMAKLKMIEALEQRVQKMQGSLADLGARDYHVALSRMTVLDGVIEFPLFYRSGDGVLTKSTLFVSGEEAASGKIEGVASSRGLRPTPVSDSTELGEERLSFSLFEAPSDIVRAQRSLRNRLLARALAQGALDESKAQEAMETFALGPGTLEALAEAFKKAGAGVPMEDVKGATSVVDALYEAAVSEEDFQAVSELYGRLGDVFGAELEGEEELARSIRNRERIAAHAALALREKGVLLAGIFKEDFDLAKVLGMTTSLFFDSETVDDEGNIVVTPSRGAGEAVAFLKQAIAAAQGQGKGANLRLAFVDLEKQILPSAYAGFLQNFRELFGLPAEISPGNPVLFVGIQEVYDELSGGEAAPLDEVTSALRAAVARKAQTDPNLVAIMAKEGDAALRARLVGGLAAFFAAVGPNDQPPMAEAIRISLELLGKPEGAQISPELVSALAKCYGKTQSEVEEMIGSMVAQQGSLPPQPSTSASRLLDEGLGNAEEELMGQAA